MSELIGYERRVVCFFDILGWKEHILDAGADPVKIAALTKLLKIFGGDEIRALNSGSHRLTSFSDCVIISCIESEVDLPSFISGLSKIFLGAAYEGFFLRAGVTIGDICHREDMVFGPALNRAYLLESAGNYPRIVLDNEVDKLRDFKCVEEDEGTFFIDAFKYLLGGGDLPREAVLESLGRIEHRLSRNIDNLSSKPQSKKGVCKKSSSPLEKMSWLYNRTRRLINDVFNRRI